MSDYVTTHQAEDLLRMDRATIYRMLRDGRLRGSKIGAQWRILRADIEQLLRGEAQACRVSREPESVDLPMSCIQAILELFSQVSRLGAILIDHDGTPITPASGWNLLCRSILGSQSGNVACCEAWREMSLNGGRLRGFTCHAGLDYLVAPVSSHAGPPAVRDVLLVLGPFYWRPPDPEEEARRLRRVADAYHVPYGELAGTAHTIPIIPEEQHAQIEEWARVVARAISSVVQERANYVLRIQQIARLIPVP